jgi:hypothetical protein
MPLEIESYAKKLGVAPGIIVGRLQHEELVSKAFGNDLKTKIELYHFQENNKRHKKILSADKT